MKTTNPIKERNRNQENEMEECCFSLLQIIKISQKIPYF